MRSCLCGLVLMVSLLGGTPAAWADHGAGGGGLAINRSILELLYPPRTNAFFNLQFNSLRSGSGNTVLYQFGGEYAFMKIFSIGAILPVWTAHNVLIPTNTKLGDVALLFKAEIWESPKVGANLFSGLNTTFPTGNDQVSLGAGAVAFLPYVTFILDRDIWDFFLNFEIAFEASSDVNPTLAYEAGLLFLIIKGKIPVSFLLSYQGANYLVSDTFTSLSTKGYVKFGFLLEVAKHWELALQGRISIVDLLTLKTDIPFNDFATGLFDDIKGSFLFNWGYKF